MKIELIVSDKKDRTYSKVHEWPFQPVPGMQVKIEDYHVDIDSVLYNPDNDTFECNVFNPMEDLFFDETWKCLD